VGPATALDFAAAQLAVAPDLIAAATERDARAAADEARSAAAAEGRSAVEQDAAAATAEASLRAERQELLATEIRGWRRPVSSRSTTPRSRSS
jgi:hypothetical protein